MPVLPPQTAAPKEKDDAQENNRRKIIFALFFLLLSFGCTLGSSQLALLTIDRTIIEESMRSAEQADYSSDLAIAFAPLDEDIAEEAARDEELLLAKHTPIAQGLSIAVLPHPVPTPTPTAASAAAPDSGVPSPSPVLVPQEVTSTAAALVPTSSPAPPTATRVAPTATSLPPTPTSVPPTPTAPLPTSTLVPPSPTLEPPTPTAAPATFTPAPPTRTSTPAPPPPPPPTPTQTPPTLLPVNNPPVSVDDSPPATNEDTPITIDVLANDSDDDGVLVAGSVEVIRGPGSGTVSVNPATGVIVYSPAPNASGAVSFTYQVCDDGGACSAAVVTIIITPVNDVPIAVTDVYTTKEDTQLIAAIPGLLGNDTDVDTGDTLTAAVVSDPVRGTLLLAPDGSFTYTPQVNFYGVDTFAYQACDKAGACATAPVSLTITPVNDPPVAAADLASTAEDTPEVIPVLENDSDVDGPDPLSIAAVGIPGHGTVTTNGINVTYTPDADFNGTDTFTYTITDSLLETTGVVTVSVEPVNDPLVAVADTYVLSGTNLSIAAPGVLGNDRDVDGYPLTAVLETGAVNGDLLFHADGSFDYTPHNPASFGGDSFSYYVSNGLVNSNVAVVTISPD